MISAPVLSTLAAFDDLRRCIQVLTDGVSEEEFLKVLRLQEKFRVECLSGIQEAQRLQKELDVSLQNMADLETKLFHARRLLEMESKSRREAEHERDQMEKKIIAVAEVMQNDRDLKEETRGKLAFLNAWPKKRKSVNAHVEEKYGNDINSTGSFLSDLSLTQSEDDFLDVRRSKNWVKHRPSLPKTTGSYVGGKRSRLSVERDAASTAAAGDAMHGAARNHQRKSGCKSNRRQSYVLNSNDKNKSTLEIGLNDKIYATTKVTIPPDGGPIRAESTIKAVPMDVEQCPNSSTPKNPNFVSHTQSSFKDTPVQTPQNVTSQLKRGLMRQHNFTPKTFIRAETCSHCQKKIRFGMNALRCRDCSLRCHADCSIGLTVSCVPQSGTPTFKGHGGYISDHAPTNPPFIPALIIHCVNEIEARGLTEVGLYRVSATEREIKALKERFLRSKGAPHLGNIDIHIICGCLKDFLRSLREPLIPTNLWKDFSNSIQNVNESEIQNDLFKAIDALPLPNRDTLAFLILHFQRIAECPAARMPIENISRVFGPTIVGYSSPDPDQHTIFTETVIQFSVMQNLMTISSVYWTQFINYDSNKENTAKMTESSLNVPQTPTTQKEAYSFYATPIKSTIKKRKFLTSATNSSRK